MFNSGICRASPSLPLPQLWLCQCWPHFQPARTMRHPAGATPRACCSGIDCREVTDRAISERPGGYVVKGTGEMIAYTDTRVKDSPDGVYHWCSVRGADDSRTICLFVPPKGF